MLDSIRIGVVNVRIHLKPLVRAERRLHELADAEMKADNGDPEVSMELNRLGRVLNSGRYNVEQVLFREIRNVAKKEDWTSEMKRTLEDLINETASNLDMLHLRNMNRETQMWIAHTQDQFFKATIDLMDKMS